MGNRTLSVEQFIDRARKVHKTRYSYHLVEYVDMLTKVTVSCSKHGPFRILPCNHIWQKQGCRKCAHDRNRMKGMNNFFSGAREIHKDRYDYSKVKYVGMKHKIEIICPIHGSFFQTPNAHINQKSRCPHKQCATRKRKSSPLSKKEDQG